MYVAELKYPGVWLDLPDREQARKIENVIRSMAGQLDEAALALHLFEQVQQAEHEQRQRREHRPSEEEWDKDMARKWEIADGYRRILRGDDAGYLGFEAEEEVRNLADVHLKREKWNAGAWPESYRHNLPFLHAKSFLYSMDMLGKMMGGLSKMDGVPSKVADHHKAYSSGFPHLKGVRDSVQHMEERSRGLTRGKPLDLQPVNNQMINAPAGGALILNSLMGNVYGSTMSDGHYGEVEVSRRTLAVAQGHMQKIIDEFPWRGPKMHRPL